MTKTALGYDQVKDYVFNTAKGKVMKQTNGLYPAPLKILEVLRSEKHISRFQNFKNPQNKNRKSAKFILFVFDVERKIKQRAIFFGRKSNLKRHGSMGLFFSYFPFYAQFPSVWLNFDISVQKGDEDINYDFYFIPILFYYLM